MRIVQCKSRILRIIAPIFLLFASACAHSAPHTVTQISTINSLLAGSYDGHLSLNDLLSYGDLGIGTYDALDGEMVVLNGRVFQVKADGTVAEPQLGQTTPYAAVSRFHPDKSLSIQEGTDYERLGKLIKEALPNEGIFVAVRAHGTFSLIKTRSVPRQQKPYPPLVEVTRSQPEFLLQGVSGTIVGFRSPAFSGRISVPSLHLHFIADDLNSGGHVLDFVMAEGEVELERCDKFLLLLPNDDPSGRTADLSVNRMKELEEAER